MERLMQMSQHKLELRDRWVNELYLLKTGTWLSMKHGSREPALKPSFD